MQTASSHQRDLELVDAAREVVDEPQQRVVDDALLGERGLDVPAHRACAARASPGTATQPFGPGRRSSGLSALTGQKRSARPRVERDVAGAAVDGLLQPRVDLVDGKLLLIGHFARV